MANLETILNIRVEGTSDMVKFKDAIDKTSEELKQLKKAQKDAGADGAKYNRQIVESETKLKSMRKQLNGQKNDLIKTNNALKATGKSYNDLTKQNAKLSMELRKLADPLGKDRKEFEKLSGQINKNTAQMSKMDKAMGRSHRNVGNYGGAIKGMAFQIGAAVMAFKTLERVIGVFVDFEFQIKQVGVISGATAGEMKELEKQAKDLGSSTAFTAGEVAGLQKELAKLGFDPTEIQNMTSSILDLAFAFGEDLSTTTALVGSTLRQFNLDSAETSRVTDVMAAGFANSALDLSKFETAMSKVGPVASAMGFTLEDTTSILGVLANSGMDASTMGTSLKNIFLKLADPAGDLAQSLGRNVTSVEELVPAMKELQAKGIDVAGMLEITDKRSVTAFASMLKNADSIDELSAKLANAEGTTQRFAEVMRDTLKGQLDETKSAAEGFAIALIESLEPVLSIVIDLISGMFKVLKKLSPVIVGLTTAFVSYKAVMLLSMAATRLWSIATTAMRIVAIATSGGVTGLTRALKLLNIAIKANPIGLLVGALAGGIALFSSMSDETEEVSDSMKKINEETERMKQVKEGLDDSQTKELANVKQLISKIKDENVERKDRLKAVKELNEIAGTNITNLSDEKKLADQLSTAYKNAVNNIKAKYILQLSEEKVIGMVKEELELQEKLQKALDAENLALRERNEVAEINASNSKSENELKYGTIQMIDAEGNAISQNLDVKKRDANRTKQNTRHEEFYQEQKTKRINIEKQINNLQNKQNDEMKDAQSIIDGLITTTQTSNKTKIEERTEYQLLQDDVALYTTQLKEAITTGGDVVTATNNLKEAKRKLIKVDKQVAKVNKELNEEFKENNDGIETKVDKINEAIDADKKQLESMKLLESEGARITKERIQQAMKIAKAQLDLALITIQSSDDSTETQIKNINDLKREIEGYEQDLESFGSDQPTTGWLKKSLFGSKEDGTDFTGEELVESISMAVGQVMEIMSAMNQLQHTQMDAEIQGIEGTKNKEIEALKETTKYKQATSEEQAKMEETITKKHDKKILDLKIAQFDRDKKMMKAQALMAGAMAVMQIWSSSATGNAIADAIIKGVMTAAMVALTGIQISTINAQAPPTAELGGIEGESFAMGGMVHGRSHKQGGEKFAVGGRVVELEGGEAVINKKSTAMFRPMLSSMNVAGGGRKFADGGMVMATDMMEQQSLAMSNALTERSDQRVYLVEADVTDSQLAVKNIEAHATF